MLTTVLFVVFCTSITLMKFPENEWLSNSFFSIMLAIISLIIKDFYIPAIMGGMLGGLAITIILCALAGMAIKTLFVDMIEDVAQLIKKNNNNFN